MAASSGPAQVAVPPIAPPKRTGTARPKVRRHGIYRSLISTCSASVDIPAPVISTTPITCNPAPPLDAFQASVSNAFVRPIAWFDSLFFNNDQKEIETNHSYLRVIVGPQWVNGQGLTMRRAIRVKVAVPHLQHRLNLIFSSDDDDVVDRAVTDKAGLTSNGLPISSTVRPDSVNRSRAGLGYELLRWIDTDVNVETALRSQERGELSLRIRHKLPRWYGTLTKFYLTGFWLQGTGFGSTAELNNERVMSARTILHFDNGVTQLHDVNGVVEDSRLSLEIELSRKAGLSPGVGFRGTTSPDWRTTSVYTSVVYRQSFFRDWLFYEFEPGVNWNRDDNGAFPTQPFAALRFEAQFRESEN